MVVRNIKFGKNINFMDEFGEVIEKNQFAPKIKFCAEIKV